MGRSALFKIILSVDFVNCTARYALYATSYLLRNLVQWALHFFKTLDLIFSDGNWKIPTTSTEKAVGSYSRIETKTARSTTRANALCRISELKNVGSQPTVRFQNRLMFGVRDSEHASRNSGNHKSERYASEIVLKLVMAIRQMLTAQTIEQTKYQFDLLHFIGKICSDMKICMEQWRLQMGNYLPALWSGFQNSCGEK